MRYLVKQDGVEAEARTRTDQLANKGTHSYYRVIDTKTNREICFCLFWQDAEDVANAMNDNLRVIRLAQAIEEVRANERAGLNKHGRF